MAKKRLTVKERTAQRTKKARDLFTNSLKTHFLVHTGHVTNDSHEETRIALDRKYKRLEKKRG